MQGYKELLFDNGTRTRTMWDNVTCTFEEFYIQQASILIFRNDFIQNIYEILKCKMIIKNLAILEMYETIFNSSDPWNGRLFNILENGTNVEFLKCNKTILVDTA